MPITLAQLNRAIDNVIDLQIQLSDQLEAVQRTHASLRRAKAERERIEAAYRAEQEFIESVSDTFGPEIAQRIAASR